jgi:hypothetical protein
VPNSPLTSLKTAYAAGARTTGRVLVKTHVMSEQPPSRDKRARHWLHSLTRVHDSLAIARLDVPWWTYRAIDVVEVWLAARPGPARVFEYGSGASTLWLAGRSAEVHSVEHHAEFGAMMSERLADVPNVHLDVVEAQESDKPRVPSGKEGHQGLDFAAYVDALDRVEGTFDLVVVDGRAREACLTKALPRLSPGGIVVYDNSARRRYRPAIEQSGLEEHALRGLTPTLPYPDQTSVLVRTR